MDRMERQGERSPTDPAGPVSGAEPADPGGRPGGPATGTAPAPALTRAELSRTVRTAVSDVLGTELDDIGESTDLGADFGIDSLELMDVGARLENVLRVKIPVSDLLEARTVGDAVDLLEKRLARPA